MPRAVQLRANDFFKLFDLDDLFSAGVIGLMDAIDSADDPAMAAYMFGRTSEQYMTDQSKITAQNVASKIEKNLKKPGTLGQVKSGKPEAQEKSPKDMTPEEFKAFRLKTVGFE